MKPLTSTNNLLDIFVGVDIGKSFHCATAINSRGNVLLKPLKLLASAEGFTAFEGRLRQLGDQTKLLIGLEASGHYWMSLWRFLLERALAGRGLQSGFKQQERPHSFAGTKDRR